MSSCGYPEQYVKLYGICWTEDVNSGDKSQYISAQRFNCITALDADLLLPLYSKLSQSPKETWFGR
jgi:hypothetical protein